MTTNQFSRLTKGKNRKVLTFLIHLVCISIIFVIPEVLTTLTRRGTPPPFSITPYLKSVVWIIAFYISYYFATDPTTGRRSDIVKFSLQNLLILAGSVVVMYFMWEYLRPEIKPDIKPVIHSYGSHGGPHGGPHPKGHLGPGLGLLVRDGVVTVLALALALALKIAEKLRSMEKQQREYLEREREAELQQLKAQLNPHFLFNTLNSIYVLVDISPDKARDSIHRLSRMLRYMLYENPPTVSLGDEIKFLESYVELMRLRLSSSVPALVTLDAGDCENTPIAPLLFINILENAFKHGTNASSPGPITIRLTVKDNVVTCYTSNAYDPDSSARKSGGGIGLANLRRRLEIQYPGRHELTVTTTDTYNVTLKIDISSPPEMSLLTQSTS